MKFTSAIVLCLLLVIVQGKRRRNFGTDLDHCKNFRAGCSLTHFNDTPYFVVDNYVSNHRDCSDYIPTDPNDVRVGNANEVIQKHCKDGDNHVRMCIMEQKFKRTLAKEQNLRVARISQLDFGRVNLESVPFKGSCWVCP